MADNKPANLWQKFLARPNTDSVKTVGIALIVAMACGLAVSSVAVLLRPVIQSNMKADQRAAMSAMLDSVPGIADILGETGADSAEVLIVDLDAGSAATGVDVATFDQAAIAADPETSLALAAEDDLAGIGRRGNYAQAYLVRQDGDLALVVLPIYGKGYQSTIRAYLALEADLETVAAFTVYEQGETPGLGARISDQAWQAQWSGKSIGTDGAVDIEVVRGKAEGPNQVDGVSGASITGLGVTNMIRFWLGPQGFGPWLQTLRDGGE